MWWCKARLVPLVLIALLLIGNAPAPASAADETCEIEHVAGLGPACLRDDGLYEVFSSTGESLGFTHGHDPVPDEAEEQAVSTQALRDPSCVNDAREGYYARVIYAWASDRQPTRSDDKVRDLVRGANGYVYESANRLGATRDLRVLCDRGTIDVLRIELPTTWAATTFSTVVQDLQAMERTHDTDDPKVHYWIFFEDTSQNCNCGGTGHIWYDESQSLNNRNNGFDSMYAVTWGYESYRTMLHEISHNNGAVQNGSPNSSGASHCNDGHDIMCYSDGGPKSNYNHHVCSPQVFDCNNNDYFHTDPPSSTYLSRYWNLGDVENRFMRGCYEATGRLFFGSPVDVPVIGWLPPKGIGKDVPQACWGRPFLLEGWQVDEPIGPTQIRPIAYLDICWYAGDTQLECSRTLSFGLVRGEVPSGTTEVRITTKVGQDVSYFLRVG